MLIARAVAAAGVGVAFALSIALVSPWLRNAVELDRFRFGSAVALGVLALTIVGVVPNEAPVALIVLGVTALLALDPTRAREAESRYRPDDIDVTAAMSDGGAQPDDEDPPEDERVLTEAGSPDRDRPPWF